MQKDLKAKTLGALAIAAVICGFAPGASAAGSGTNTLADITIEGTQFARIALNGAALGGRPACHNAGYTVHFGFDISTAKGKALLSTASAALLAGKQVSATGANACTNIGAVTIETLTTLTIWP